MTALGAIQISLCVFCLAAAAILIPIVQYQRYRYMRGLSHKAFDRAGISSPAFLWREDREAQSHAFDRLVSSRQDGSPKDPRLKVLQRRESIIWRACGLSFALLLLTFLMFRADPNHVWDLLVDLAHY